MHSFLIDKDEESKSFVATLQEMLPEWLTGKSKDSRKDGRREKRRGRRRSHTPSQTENRDGRERRQHRHSSKGDKGTELRRRERRATGRKKSIIESYPNPGYDPSLQWDALSIDSLTP